VNSDQRLRVLFVDDEAPVRSSLQLAVERDVSRPFDALWAEDGLDALEAMERQPVDIVVSDIIMPRMDGATLLAEVRRRWPATLRLVLSGHMDRERKITVLPVAHLILSKPCTYDALRVHLVRACELRTRLRAGGLDEFLDRIEQLPAAPRLYGELTRVMGDPRAGLGAIAAIVDRDPAIAARVLQLANSAWVGLPRRVGTTRDALRVLGLDLLRKLVLTVEVFEVFGGLGSGVDIADLRDHAVTTARIAGKLASPDDSPAATTAALLHDVGELALSVARPDAWARARARHAAGESLVAAQRAELGWDHADAGAALLDLWGLPLSALHAVGAHHSPERLAPGLLDTAGVVYLANELAHAAAEGRIWELARSREPLHPDWVASFDDATLTRWAALAERVWLDTRAGER
jgi:HD-like signal output (HDOD) protein/ActR/RegA family two-component response regulator